MWQQLSEMNSVVVMENNYHTWFFFTFLLLCGSFWDGDVNQLQRHLRVKTQDHWEIWPFHKQLSPKSVVIYSNFPKIMLISFWFLDWFLDFDLTKCHSDNTRREALKHQRAWTRYIYGHFIFLDKHTWQFGLCLKGGSISQKWYGRHSGQFCFQLSLLELRTPHMSESSFRW